MEGIYPSSLRFLSAVVLTAVLGLWGGGGSGAAQISCSPCTQSLTVSTSELFRGCLLGGPFSRAITATDVQVPQPITLTEDLVFQVEFALTNYIVYVKANVTCTGIDGCDASDFKLNRIDLRKKTRSPAISTSTGPSPCDTSLSSACSLDAFREIFRGGGTAGVSGDNACSSPSVDGAVTWEGRLLLDLQDWDVTASGGSVTGTLEALVEDETP